MSDESMMRTILNSLIAYSSFWGLILISHVFFFNSSVTPFTSVKLHLIYNKKQQNLLCLANVLNEFVYSDVVSSFISSLVCRCSDAYIDGQTYFDFHVPLKLFVRTCAWKLCHHNLYIFMLNRSKHYIYIICILFLLLVQ